MKFKIPFTFSSTEILVKKTKGVRRLISTGKKSFQSLEENLKNADAGLSKDEYLAICLRTLFISFIVLSTIITSGLVIFIFSSGITIQYFYFYGLAAAALFSGFIFFNQMSYPRVYSLRKTRNVEKNLIPAMQDILVQLNSGVPIFKILVNIAGSDYGAVSDEFTKAVKAINSGQPQIEAIEELGNRTTSLYFKRVLWQISNGMRAGSDMGIVIKDGIENLSKEQVIQIQSYGSKLNPLIMFYMLLTVILPALGITFLTIIASMIGLQGYIVQLLFVGIFILVILVQIVFLGMVRTRRPSLL